MTNQNIHPEGTLLLDAATGLTYRARRAYEGFGKNRGIQQDFTVQHLDGAVGMCKNSELPEQLKVIWAPAA